MNQRALIIAVVVFVLVVAGMFGYAYMKKQELAPAPTPFVETPTPEDESPMRVDAVHFFNDGQHTIVGELLLPTPCHLIKDDVTVGESMPEQVKIALSLINNADTCAQVLTPQRFSVSFTASQYAVITVTVDGKPVTLNLRDAGPDESPDTLDEFFFKG